MPGLSKFLSGNIIKSIYPMIDEIEAFEITDANFIVFRVYLNDREINSDNMYKKGLDPHYLMDYHITKYLPYFGIRPTMGLGFVLVGPDNKVIQTYLE